MGIILADDLPVRVPFSFFLVSFDLMGDFILKKGLTVVARKITDVMNAQNNNRVATEVFLFQKEMVVATEFGSRVGYARGRYYHPSHPLHSTGII